MTRDEAIEYCFAQIKPSIMDKKEYDKYRLIRNRYKKGQLREQAIKTLFRRFGIEEHCYFTKK